MKTAFRKTQKFPPACASARVRRWELTSVATDLAGKNLYVANRLSDDISVIDLATEHETKRIHAGRGASYLARAGTTPFIYCSHVYANINGVRRAPESQITAIDLTRWPLKISSNTRMATALFLAWIDASGVGCPWAISNAPVRKNRATTDSRRMAHLSAD